MPRPTRNRSMYAAAAAWLLLAAATMVVQGNLRARTSNATRTYVLNGVGGGEWVRIFDPERDVRIMFPQAVFVAAMLAFPVWWSFRMDQPRARRLRGLCPTCGYDLRGTPGRCPECGTVPEADGPASR
jgi:hypothetical protein